MEDKDNTSHNAKLLFFIVLNCHTFIISALHLWWINTPWNQNCSFVTKSVFEASYMLVYSVHFLADIVFLYREIQNDW